MREILIKVLDAQTKETIGYERTNKNGHWENQRLNRVNWLLGAITSEDNLIRIQYTGLTDKNGVKIFEGDEVECVNGHIGYVEWEEHDCMFNVTDYYSPSNDYPTIATIEGQPFKVIGNIHD